MVELDFSFKGKSTKEILLILKKEGYFLQGYISPTKLVVSKNPLHRNLKQSKNNLRLNNHVKRRIPLQDGNQFVIHSTAPIHQLQLYLETALHTKVKLFSFKHKLSYTALLTVPGHLTNTTISILADYSEILWFDFYTSYKHHLQYAIAVVGGYQVAKDEDTQLLTGKGITIAIADTGIDTNNCFAHGAEKKIDRLFTFTGSNEEFISNSLQHLPLSPNRLIAEISFKFYDGLKVFETDTEDEPDGHGEHVFSIAAGDNTDCQNMQTKIKSDAKIMFVDLSKTPPKNSTAEGSLLTPYTFTPVLEMVYASGAKIFTNSWGAAVPYYTYLAMEIDQFVYFHNDLLVLFANGNNGPAKGSVSSPATFKNGLSIGASENAHISFLFMNESNFDSKFIKGVNWTGGAEQNLADFSSRGPTRDGRIKPDFVAPGEWILGARAGSKDKLLYMRGTSQATPLVARFASKLLQILPDKSTASLVKVFFAVLSHNLTGRASRYTYDRNSKYYVGTKIKGALTENDQGWGAILFPEQLLHLVGYKDHVAINNYDVHSYCFRVKEASKVNFALSWVDPPAIPYASKVLINDLNLRVETPGSIYLGNNHEDTLHNLEKTTVMVYYNEILRVTVSTPSRVAVLPPVEHQEYAFAFSPSNILLEIPCEYNCSKSDPEHRCEVTIPGTNEVLVGARQCVNGKLSEQCYMPCAAKNFYVKDGNCSCLYNRLCTAGKDNGFAISYCDKNVYDEKCTEERLPRYKNNYNDHVGKVRQLLTTQNTVTNKIPMVIVATCWILTFLMALAFTFLKRK